MSERTTPWTWILANAFGMSLGFLVFIQTLMFLAFGLDFANHWSAAAVEGLEDSERLLHIGLAIGLPLAGTTLATSQAWALRGRLSSLWQWVLCGPAGFAVMILVIWPFTAIWGDIPGPVEPLTIVGGGLLMTGMLQWLLLRRRGIDANRWLLLWIVGLPLGFLVTAAVIYGTGEVVGYPPWPLEIALVGFIIGGTAAAVSGRTLHGRISPGTERSTVAPAAPDRPASGTYDGADVRERGTWP